MLYAENWLSTVRISTAQSRIGLRRIYITLYTYIKSEWIRRYLFKSSKPLILKIPSKSQLLISAALDRILLGRVL